MSVHAGTGLSSKKEAFEAGQSAAQDAIKQLDGCAPEIVFVFTSPRYDLAQLIKGIRSVTGATQLVGATGSGEIMRDSYMAFGMGVGVMVLSGGNYRYGVASADHVWETLADSGQKIARAARDAARPGKHSAVILLADCMAGNLQNLFNGVYRVTGPRVPIVGGAAGDEMKFVASYVFHDDKVVEKGAVALWISSDTPIEIVTRHGWEPIGIPLLVTRAEGIDIMELDGRPAAAVYEEQLGIAPGELDAANFWATSVHHPLGLMQSDGSFIIRAARAKSENGWLRIQGCVPQAGSAVQVMESTKDKLLAASDEVGALARREGAGALLTFSCAARAMLLGERTPEESARQQQATGEVPNFGIYCCGEFARTSGVLGTHNCTLTALAL